MAEGTPASEPVSVGQRGNFWQSFRNGLRQRCPRCGQGALYRRYLKVNPTCSHCELDLESFRADDAPAYFTIAIVGHLVVPAMLVLEQVVQPATWIHVALWMPLTLLLSLALLPIIKGAVIAANWKVDRSADRMQ
ncbi:MAG: DUF983 domain-containing protein [Alphaproteobacteria bacterium]|nr:DUF983 domain-containing protein [Alphaproteobacteria bacterium]